MYMPYTEADHVLNIAFNIFAGGTCLEHLELRRNDEAFLNLLGAQRQHSSWKGQIRRLPEISVDVFRRRLSTD